MKRLTILICSLLLCFASASAAEPLTLVACAPGYPGNTEQAQPTMDDLAAALSEAMAVEPGRVAAIYHRELEAGLARLSQTDATIALVPLPFYLQYREELKLRPLAQALPTSGAAEVWSLVAGRGTLAGAASLAGWEITGMPGYAPGFVRDVALSDWGKLPDGVAIRFTARTVSALRRTAAGEKVAVLLDAAQTESLPALPFAKELEVVAHSKPLPTSLVCAVGERLTKDDAAKLVPALLGLDESDSGRELLAALRMTSFESLDNEAIERAETAFEGAAE